MPFRNFVLITSALTLFACGQPASQTDSVDADDIHKTAIVIDSHSDFLDRSEIDGSHLNDDVAGAQTTLSKLQQGQVDAQFFSIFVPPAFEQHGFAKRTDELIDRLEKEVRAHPDKIELVSSSADIRRLANSRKIAALIGIEGGHSIENDLAKLRHFYKRGVRYMTLTWSNTNGWADSSGDEAKWSGLNDLGRQVVAEMNQLGMMVDISHVSDDTFWDVIEATKSPVIASHSSMRSIMASKRNMSDEMVRAVRKNGGVVQVSFFSQYLDKDFADRFEAAKAGASAKFKALETKYADDPVQLDIESWSLEKQIEARLTPPDARRVVDHIDHVVKLAGIDHVGLGSDYDGMGAAPKGLEHVGKIDNITKELIQRGYSKADIEKVLGGNLLRVFAENERLAGAN